MGESTPVIELRGIDFAYDHGPPVLRGVDLTLAAGDRIGLVGANGSGKTTLLHIVMGLLRPTSGAVRAFGRERRIEEDFHEVRERVGFVFQDPDDQLFCPTVAEDVAFGPFNLGWRRERVEAAVADTLAMLGLESFRDRVTHRLSFGEKKLVSLACVLAMQPEALLLDEPSAGLDTDVAARLIDILSANARTLLVVSHDDAFLEQVTKGRRRLREGRLLADEHRRQKGERPASNAWPVKADG